MSNSQWTTLKTRKWIALLCGPIVFTLALVPGSSAAKSAQTHKAATPLAHAGSASLILAQEQAAPANQADKPEDPGAAAYTAQCSICHQADRNGLPPTFPTLVGVTGRLSDAQIADIVHNGRGRMPAQPTLEPATVTAIITYLKTSDAAAPAPTTPPPAAQ